MAIAEAYLETNKMHGEIIPTILTELPRNPDLEGAFHTPWKNMQAVIEIIIAHQTHGALKKESPFVCLSAFLGPLMTGQMFRRANLGYPIPEIKIKEHVNSFLHGRKL